MFFINHKYLAQFFSDKIMLEVKALLNINLSAVYFITEEGFNYAKFKTAEVEGVLTLQKIKTLLVA